ncbi:MAG: hypothetical protein QOH96_4104 [Blastocatellia bacterium]|nr:hypothetical protein [Blastocatellia bacterium]
MIHGRIVYGADCMSDKPFPSINSLRFQTLNRLLSELWKCHSMLPLILPSPVLIGGFAYFVSFEEYDLGNAFVGIDFGGKRCRVGELECDVAFPFRFEGCDIYDDTAAGVGAFPETDRQDVAGDSKIFDRARQGETIRWNDDRVTFDVDKIVRVKVLWVDDGAVQIGK